MRKMNKWLYVSEKEEPLSVIEYDFLDIEKFKRIYSDWFKLNRSIKEIGGSSIILPPELVKNVVAYFLGYWTVDDMGAKFDCYDRNAHDDENRILIKYGVRQAEYSFFDPDDYFDEEWDIVDYVYVDPRSSEECYFDVYVIDMRKILSRVYNSPFERKNMYRINIFRDLVQNELYKEHMRISLFDDLHILYK